MYSQAVVPATPRLLRSRRCWAHTDYLCTGLSCCIGEIPYPNMTKKICSSTPYFSALGQAEDLYLRVFPQPWKYFKIIVNPTIVHVSTSC